MNYRTIFRSGWAGILLFISNSLSGQIALHAPFLTGSASSLWAQPALRWGAYMVGGWGGYDAFSSSFTLDHITLKNTFIDAEMKNRFIGQLEDRNRFNFVFSAGGLAEVKVKKISIQATFRQIQHFDIQFTGDDAARLLLLGNAPYAGQTLLDPDISYLDLSGKEWGIGSHFSWKGWQGGIRFKVLTGVRLNSLSTGSFSLYTAPNGSYLDISTSYDYFTTGTNPGYGLAADAGLIYQNNKLMAAVALSDLGFAQAEGNRRALTQDTRFEGLDVSSLIGADLSNGISINFADTLSDLLLAPEVADKQRQALPAQIRLYGSYALRERHQIALTILSSQRFQAPLLVNAAWYYKPMPSHTLGINAYAGGIDKGGVGLAGSTTLHIPKGPYVVISAEASQTLGGISQKQFRGLAFQVGLTLFLYDATGG